MLFRGGRALISFLKCGFWPHSFHISSTVGKPSTHCKGSGIQSTDKIGEWYVPIVQHLCCLPGEWDPILRQGRWVDGPLVQHLSCPPSQTRSHCEESMRQMPVQEHSSEHLTSKLQNWPSYQKQRKSKKQTRTRRT